MKRASHTKNEQKRQQKKRSHYAAISAFQPACAARRGLLGLCLLTPLAFATMTAQAIEIQGNDWTLDVGGIVDAYYTAVSCSGAQVGGPSLASKAVGCNGENHGTTIGNGLLPSGLITKFKTVQEGIEIGGTIGIMVPVSNTSGVGTNSNVDVRQAFFTLGTAQAGTLKLGRDYGIFGANAILGDMTLLGAGAPSQSSQANRVTLGHIGAGYTYLDNYGQITYVSPVLGGGFTFSGGVMSPVNNGGATSLYLPNGTVLTNHYVSKAYPQLQAQIAWAGDGFKAWLGAKSQKFYAASGSGVNGDFTDNAAEVGVSYSGGPFGFLANYQEGKGIGILSDGDEGPIKGRNYFIQGTYKLTDKLKFGLNYGVSRNSDNNQYNDLLNASFKSNSNVTGGLYYSLTKSVTLVGELGETESKDYFGDTSKMYGGSVGGIIFF